MYKVEEFMLYQTWQKRAWLTPQVWVFIPKFIHPLANLESPSK